MEYEIKLCIFFFTLHVFMYWVTVLYMCLTGQDDSHRHRDVGRIVKRVLINQIVWTPVVAVPTYFAIGPFSNLPWYHSVWQIPACIVVDDVLFYHLHRLVHTKLLYKSVHKMHHEFQRPIAAASLWAHPAEHIFVNIFPPVAAALIVKSNFLTAFLWFSIASTNVVLSHSRSSNGGSHGYHHVDGRCNFGSGLYLCDRLYGTFHN